MFFTWRGDKVWIMLQHDFTAFVGQPVNVYWNCFPDFKYFNRLVFNGLRERTIKEYVQ